MSPKDADRMANSVDHDQTAQSHLGLQSAQTCLSEILGSLRSATNFQYRTYYIMKYLLSWKQILLYPHTVQIIQPDFTQIKP